MPAMLDDPTSPTIYRTSGQPPYPTPMASLPLEIEPRQLTLRDRTTTATLMPFSSPTQVPMTLLSYLCDQLNREIEKGDTYPMVNPLPLETFGPYWFANFGAIMLLGHVDSAEELRQMEADGESWEQKCLGSFYIKPNYPGRSSHVCNGGFLVTDASRNRGLGRLMGETYLDWAPKLGYTYSVFNLVYESNVASCRIWDALGFKRIGRVKGCGNLRSYPDQLIDAIIYGRDLSPEGEDFISEERFDKIRYYLKHGQYPAGADRAEKSRLRSAATHYKLILAQNGQQERLMLKDKEVVSDVQRQYQIAREEHLKGHGGINKTTAGIAEKFHWVRIKETVSQVIKNCTECSKDVTKQQATARAEGQRRMAAAARAQQAASLTRQASSMSGLNSSSNDTHTLLHHHTRHHSDTSPAPSIGQPSSAVHPDPQEQHPIPMADFQSHHHLVDYQVPVDPRLTTGYADFGNAAASSSSASHLVVSHTPQGAVSQTSSSPHAQIADQNYSNREAARALEALQQRQQQDEDFALQQNAAMQQGAVRHPHQSHQQLGGTGPADEGEEVEEKMMLDGGEEDVSSRVLQTELMNAGFGRAPVSGGHGNGGWDGGI